MQKLSIEKIQLIQQSQKLNLKMDQKQLIKFFAKKGIKRNQDDQHYYWPEGKTRPHFHFTKGYIGTENFNLIDKSGEKIKQMWNGTRGNALAPQNWDRMDVIMQQLIKQLS